MNWRIVMPKYIERYENTKRPIRFKDKVKIINGRHKGEIGYVGAKDPDGLPAYNIWFDDGTFDCLMSDEFINAEENIVDLQILAEHGACTEKNSVLVRYKRLKENRVVEKWYKYYQTEYGRYIKINGRRYYIDGRYRYFISKKGDDFNFSNLRVHNYRFKHSILELKPITEIKLKEFKTLLERNNKVLDKNKEAFDEMNLWEEIVDEIWYDATFEKVELVMYCCDGLFNFEKITNKDKEIFETLKEMYLSDIDEYEMI